jgi:hypothetical protein
VSGTGEIPSPSPGPMRQGQPCAKASLLDIMRN